METFYKWLTESISLVRVLFILLAVGIICRIRYDEYAFTEEGYRWLTSAIHPD